ncbi:MAG: hypothetical protein KDI60_04875 [Xanthomonadales bacterium]|nr:hypothetical protein [Xanthomonadales bacterium]MCP5476986.1 hypothetical protein [Rhodanobacteraceae bacterium]
MSGQVVVYAGKTPVKHTFEVTGGSIVAISGAPSTLTNLRRLEFYTTNGNLALVIEPYFGKEDASDSTLSLRDGVLALKVWSLLRFASDDNRHPLLATLGRTRETGSTRIAADSLESIESLARAFGLTRGAGADWSGDEADVYRPPGGFARRLTPSLCGADSFSGTGYDGSWQTTQGEPNTRVVLIARSVRRGDDGEALLFGLQAALLRENTRFVAGIRDRFERLRNIRSRTITQIQSAELFDYHPKRLGLATEWIEFESEDSAADIADQAIVAPLSLALNALRGSSGLSSVTALTSATTRLRWRCRPRRLLSMGTELKANEFECEPGFALRQPYLAAVDAGSGRFPLIRAHDGKEVSYQGLIADPDAVVPPSDLLTTSPEVALRDLLSSEDYSAHAQTLHLAIAAPMLPRQSVRIGSMDLRLGSIENLAISKKAAAVVRLDFQGYQIGSPATEPLALRAGRVVLFNWPVLAITPGTSDPLPDEDRAGAGNDDPVLLFPTGTISDDRVIALLQSEENWERGKDRRFEISLTPVAAPTAPAKPLLLIDPSRLFIAELPASELANSRSGRVDGELAYYSEGVEGPRWRMVFDKQDLARSLRLPPQVLGEEMEKGGTPPTISPGALLDYRLSPPAHVALTIGNNQNLQDAIWNWRQVFGYPGQRAPGATIVSSRFELLYGLQASIDGGLTPSSVRWVEAFARRGEFNPPIDSDLVERGADADPRRLARRRRAESWLSGSAILTQRPAALELGIDGARAASGESLPRAVLDAGVSFMLRSSADLQYPVGTRPAGSHAPDGGLKGGVGWPFESRAVYEEVWAQPNSTSASLAEPVLTALGGFGEFKAGFALDKSIIRGRSALGRSEIVAVERIGRIAVYWHRAKHVIVYERSTLPSEQMRCEQPRHEGRPILRKVAEYIEILQPERRFPEDPDADLRTTGPVRGVRFVSTRIPVLSRWGQDDAQGTLVPLWNENADPSLYPKPEVLALLAGPMDADLPEVSAPFTEPQNLYFFSATDPQLDADTDRWPAFSGIDYIDRPAPLPDTLPNMGENGDESLPNAPLVPAGFERVTHRIDAQRAANLLAERSAATLAAPLQTLTIGRGRVRPSAADPTPTTLARTADLIRQAHELAGEVTHAARAGSTRLKEDFDAKKRSLIGLLDQSAKPIADAAAKLRAIAGQSGGQSLCAPLKRHCTDYLARQRLELRTVLATRIEAILALFDGEASIAVETIHREIQQAINALDEARRAQLQMPLERAVGHGLEAIEVAVVDASTVIDALQKESLTTYDAGEKAILAVIGDIAQRTVEITRFQAEVHSRLQQLTRALPSPPPLAGRAIAALQQLLAAVRQELDQLDPAGSEASIRRTLDAGRLVWFGAKGPFAVAQAAAQRFKQIADAWIASAAAPGFELNAWAARSIERLNEQVTAVAQGGQVQIAELRAAMNAASADLAQAIDQAFVAGTADLLVRIESLCSDFVALLAPLGDLKDAADRLLGSAIARLRQHLDAIDLDKPAQEIERIASRAERWIGDQASGARELVEAAEDQWRRLGQAPSFADPDSTLRLIRAVGEGPLLPEMRFNRDRIAYFFDDARNAIKTSPIAALVNRAGADLKAFGVRLPTSELADQLIPEALSKFDLDKILPDFAGVREVFRAISMPDVLPEDLIVTHGFDKESQSAWLNASIDIELADKGTMFEFAPLKLSLLERARFQAQSRLRIALDGSSQKNVSAAITADWQLEISGQPLLTFRQTALRFENGRLRFDLKPEQIELNQLIAWMGDAVRAFGSEEDGFRLELLTDSGRPVGLRALLDLPIPATGAGAVSIVGLALGARFELRVHPEFSIGVGLNLARESMPFAIFVAFLGGGGWLEVDVDYVPSSQQLSSTVTLGISAGAGAALNLGPMRGSVVLLLSVRGSYRSNQGGLTLALSLLLRGHATVWGWLHIDVAVMLVLTYGANRSLIGTGRISVTVRISRFFKVRFSTGVTYTFAKGGGKSALSKSEARAKLARAV